VQRILDGEFTMRDALGGLRRYHRYVEVLPNGARHRIIEITDEGPFDDTPVFQVPAGHYFALGDNRDSSRDSRFLGDVGYIPFENLVGPAQIIFFSVDGPIWKIWNWPQTLRVDRFFKRIN
jgi:signal peptidase I